MVRFLVGAVLEATRKNRMWFLKIFDRFNTPEKSTKCSGDLNNELVSYSNGGNQSVGGTVF